MFDGEDDFGKPCHQPVVLNGNNAQPIEDLYAKVCSPPYVGGGPNEWPHTPSLF